MTSQVQLFSLPHREYDNAQWRLFGHDINGASSRSNGVLEKSIAVGLIAALAIGVQAHLICSKTSCRNGGMARKHYGRLCTPVLIHLLCLFSHGGAALRCHETDRLIRNKGWLDVNSESVCFEYISIQNFTLH
jgi:hypothetical protein